jgi:hypothetical protein
LAGVFFTIANAERSEGSESHSTSLTLRFAEGFSQRKAAPNHLGIRFAIDRKRRRLARMRIQETDRILKESRISRNEVARNAEEPGTVARTWRMISDKVTGLFRRS